MFQHFLGCFKEGKDVLKQEKDVLKQEKDVPKQEKDILKQEKYVLKQKRTFQNRKRCSETGNHRKKIPFYQCFFFRFCPAGRPGTGRDKLSKSRPVAKF